ncbi:succinylglutamate desuccinylase [Rivularia sp. PCC 7116]|uniref:aspartoacylase n=1 Tax=Rivularia sp. PCC 7116 TaxID=373994 RepID=UPI00029EEA85|nr:aspartoacylase [Rivularia sp. PCC 7116]AFY56602.1 succinylglutamate desuccinylase [Rivularia sp. PCC 7116]
MVIPIERVALVGGTHGGEITGVFLAKKFQRFPLQIQRNGVETVTLLANKKAIAMGRRYIDTDLNRAFNPQDLENPLLMNYEQSTAKSIAQRIQQEKIDLIIDLHSTTANMGLTIILSSNHPYLLRLSAYLTEINPKVKVLQYAPNQKPCHLRSLAELGIAIEVGAIANGLLDAKLFQETEDLIHATLDYLEADRKGQSLAAPGNLTFYRVSEKVDYPRNQDGEIEAMIHPQLQFQDYKPLHPGNPIFISFDGKDIFYEGDKTVYPVFINEVAYYEKGIAMYFTQKERIGNRSLNS